MKVYIVGDNEGSARYAFTDRARAEQCKKDHQFGLEMSGSYRTASIIELELDERPLNQESR